MKDNRKTKIILLISILLLVLSLIVMVLAKKENAVPGVLNSSDNDAISNILNLYNENNSNTTNVYNYIDFVPIGVYTDENSIEIKAKGSAAFEIKGNSVKRIKAVCDDINLVTKFGVPNETIDIFKAEIGGWTTSVDRTVDIKNIHTIFSDGKIKEYNGYHIGMYRPNVDACLYERKYPAVQDYAFQIITLLNVYNSTSKEYHEKYTKIGVDIVKEESQKINEEDINIQCIKIKSPDENYIRSGKINIYSNKNNEILMIEYDNYIILGVESIKIPKANVECEKDEERIVPGYPKESYK